jgi:CxxC motif-containing protein
MANETKNLICILCPRGCHIVAIKEGSNVGVSGNFCRRGIDYGKNEMTNPTRKLTTTVKLLGGHHIRRLPVVTNGEIPKPLMFEIIKVLNTLEIKVPIKRGAIIYKNILNTNIDIISSKTVEA